ncbi:MAG: ComEC/Rec2 family competence protein [Pyrinomonadaceae bacterium]
MTSPVKRSRPDFSLYPLIWLAICFGLGILLASEFSIDRRIWLFAAAGLTGISLGFFRSSAVFILAAFVAAGAFSFQAAIDSKPQNSIKNLYDTGILVSGEPVEIEGFIENEPELAVGGFYLRIAAVKLAYKGVVKRVSGNIQFFASESSAEIKREYDKLDLVSGTKVRIAAVLLREERYHNPGSISFLTIIDQNGIDATGIIKSPLLIEIVDGERQFSPFSFIYKYRRGLIEKIRANFSASTSGILIASLLGNKHHLTKESASVFRDGGTFHVLVISGLHITFIGGILLLIVRRFTRKPFVLFLVPTGVLWIYALAVGAEIPVIRAAMMFTVLAFSYLMFRKGTLLNALGACALVIFILRPEELFSPSFQLTFASLAGIILAAFPLIEKFREIGNWSPTRKRPFPPAVAKRLLVVCETLYWSERGWRKTLRENVWDCRIFKSSYAARLEDLGLQKLLRRLFEGVLVTISVQLFLLPFLVVYFHRVSFGSIVLNLWVSFFIVFQNGFALLSIFAGLFSDTLARPMIGITEFCNRILMAVPELFISYDINSFRLPVYSGSIKLIYSVYYIPLMGMILLLNAWDPFLRTADQIDKKSRLIKLPLFYAASISHILLFSLIIFHPFSAPEKDGRLTVDFLDVGQGDSALVTFPNGETMLIDGGGKQNFSRLYLEKENGDQEPFEPDSSGVGESVVSEFLWEKGYSEIDHILATHSDADHMQGLIAVARNFRIKTAMIGVASPEDDIFTEFTTALEKNGIPVFRLDNRKRFEAGGVTVEILNPPVNRKTETRSTNNNSVVLRLTYQNRRFLLTGDIEQKVEYELLKNPQLLKADIVKVAHHGSRTSSVSKFVEAVRAEYAVIPVGKNSPFGHPNEDVVSRWELSGAKVMTTGKNGTITISTNGHDLNVQTFLNKNGGLK